MSARSSLKFVISGWKFFQHNRAMKLTLGAGPLVVGTLSSLAGNIPLAGDLIEVRLDKMKRPPDWLKRCQAIEAGGKPVLLTIRLRVEGGEWPEDNSERLQLYNEALPTLSAFDVELSSVICADVAKEAQRLGKVCVLSHHDFVQTPPLKDLEWIIEHAHRIGGVAKVATMVHKEADLETLRALLAKKWKGPLCVIAMGDAWKETRVSFPKLGSCLTYGYLDQPTAPGQWSAAELVRQLR